MSVSVALLVMSLHSLLFIVVVAVIHPSVLASDRDGLGVAIDDARLTHIRGFLTFGWNTILSA